MNTTTLIRNIALLIMVFTFCTKDARSWDSEQHEHTGEKYADDEITVTSRPSDGTGTVIDGAAWPTSSWPWSGGPVTFTSTVPDLYIGSHMSYMSGTFKKDTDVGDGIGGTAPLSWFMDVDGETGVLVVSLDGEPVISVGTGHTYSTFVKPSNAMTEWTVSSGDKTDIDSMSIEYSNDNPGKATISIAAGLEDYSDSVGREVTVVGVKSLEPNVGTLTGTTGTTSFWTVGDPGSTVIITATPDPTDATLPNDWDLAGGKYIDLSTYNRLRTLDTSGDNPAEFTCTSGTSKKGLSISVVTVDVTEVPEYIYADATAAVPVRFKIQGLSEQVEIGSVDVSFYLDGNKVFEYNNAAFAKNDGFGIKGNGQSDTYTAWVPISEFRSSACMLAGDTTENCAFSILVNNAKTAGTTQIIEKIRSDPSENSAKPLVFGDKEVKVVEIYVNNGIGNEWTVLDTATKQTRVDTQATAKYIHKSGLLHAFSPGYPHECDGTTCNGPGFPGSLSGFDIFYQTATRTSTSRELEVYLKDDADYGVGGGGEEILSRMYGETIGCYFGFSYGHRDVVVLGNAPGMDLNVKSCNCDVTMFDDGKLSMWIEDISSPTGTNQAGIAAGLLTVGWGLASTGWGIPLGVAAGVYTIIASQEGTPSPDVAEVTCYTVWDHTVGKGPSTPAYLYPPAYRMENGAATSVSYPMSRNGFPGGVGQTWKAYIILNACVSTVSTYPFPYGLLGESVKARIKYEANFNTPIQVTTY